MEKSIDKLLQSVLVVDDNPKNIQILATMLSEENLDVEFALNGSAALNWTEQKNFDLILLDIMMPVMDGFEVCRRLKENPDTNEIPVIFITAKTDTSSIIEGFKLGAIDYIIKPFIPAELRMRVRTHLEIIRARKQLRSYTVELEQKNRNITDSIKYARNIQKAIMQPSLKHLRAFPEHFILYMPQHYISGDFYWAYHNKDKMFFAAMDCTGHGVPGALMSILGITLLNEIVLHDKVTEAGSVLEHLKERVIKALGQNEKSETVRDGMEGGIITYETKTGELEYAGSYNPLLLVRNKELKVFKADRISIGYGMRKGSFNTISLNIRKNDIVYLHSDGFIDQFGGPGIKKFTSAQFHELLQKNHHLSMELQREALKTALEEWKGDNEQVDDILVTGLRFK